MKLDKSTTPKMFAVACAAALCCAWPASANEKDHDKAKGEKARITADSTTLSAEEVKFIKKAAHGGHKKVMLSRLALQKSQNPQVKDFAQKLVTDHQRCEQELRQLAASKGVQLPPMEKPVAAADDEAQTDTEAVGTAEQQERGAAAGGSQPGQSQGDYSVPRQGQEASQQRDPLLAQSKPRTPGQHAESGQHGDSKVHGEEHAQDKAEMDRIQKLSGTEFDRAFVTHTVRDHQKGIEEFEKIQQKTQDQELKAFAAKTVPVLREHLQTAQRLQSQIGQGQQGRQGQQGQEGQQNPRPISDQ